MIEKNMKFIVKTSILAAAALLFSVAVSAQGKYGADSAECIKYLSYYKEYFKQKSYDDAIPNWREAYRICPPTANQNMLIDGTTLYRRLIAKNAMNPVYKKQLIDTLLSIHDTRAKFYPKYAETALNNKGLDLANYVKDNPFKLYTSYEEIIENNREKTKYQIFLFDINAAIELYQNGTVSSEDVINAYQRNSSLLEAAPAANQIEAGQKEKIKNDMGSIFASSKVASCETIVDLYTPRFDADPENLQLATSIVKTMSTIDDCQSNDLYLKAVTTMHKMEPSAKSAYFLFRLHSAMGNTNDAVKYMEQAIGMSGEEVATIAEYEYELATFCYKVGHTATAYEHAIKVPAISQELAGKAYFLLGSIWGASNCGGNEVTRRAPYWVAVDYMIKAKNADPTLADEANSRISSYSRYFPDTAEAFMYEIANGQSYTVVCGSMKATTTVRTVNN